MVSTSHDTKSSILGLIIVGIIIVGTGYSLYYAALNNLWYIPSFFNFNRVSYHSNIASPETYDVVIEKSRVLYGELFENVTQFAVKFSGSIIGLSINWSDLGNVVWKVVVKAPDFEHFQLVHYRSRLIDNKTYEIDIEGNNVTYYVVFNKNYTNFARINFVAKNVGYFRIEYNDTTPLLIGNLTTNYSVGKNYLYLRNTEINETNLALGVSETEVHLQNVLIRKAFNLAVDVGDITFEGNNVTFPALTRIETRTGSISFSVNDLHSLINGDGYCYITTNVGSIDFEVTFSQDTEAKVDATTNVGEVSYNKDTNMDVTSEKKTKVILVTSNYFTLGGINFLISANVGSISLKVSK